jgi:hypothetical protein
MYVLHSKFRSVNYTEPIILQPDVTMKQDGLPDEAAEKEGESIETPERQVRIACTKVC